MENISENKRKRGRPLKVSKCGETVNEVAKQYSFILDTDTKTKRTQINAYYYMLALSVLRENQTVDYSFLDDHKKQKVKITILQELGRLEYANIIEIAAKRICEERLPTEKAIDYIRNFRRDKKPAGSSFKLANKIADVINDYDNKHEGVDKEFMLESLEFVRKSIVENFS